MSLSPAASRLLDARRTHQPVPPGQLQVSDAAAAYAIQDECLQVLGPVGAWKAGARTPQAEPICAPLPASGVYADGSMLQGEQWKLRLVELEVALRLSRDITPASVPVHEAELHRCFDAMLPTFEIVESRLTDRATQGPLVQLADFQNHGGLVLGTPVPLPGGQLPDVLRRGARLHIDGVAPIETTEGSNPGGALPRLLLWWFAHLRQYGRSARAGQIVTTGSLVGMVAAPAGASVYGEIDGVGALRMRFA